MSDGNKIAVLISGGGTTLKNLIQWRDEQKLSAQIELVISNNPIGIQRGLKSTTTNT